MIEKAMQAFAKAVSGLATHFKKAAEHHKALSEAHGARAVAHKAHHEFLKAKHEAMDDGDAHKAYFGKAAELHKAIADHHDNKCKLHKAHADHLEALADSMADVDKAFKAEGVGTEKVAAGGTQAAEPSKGTANAEEPRGVQAILDKTIDGLVTKALAALDTDPRVAEAIQKTVIERVQSELSNKIVPDGVKSVLPGMPPNLQLIPRAGSEGQVNTAAVDPALRKFVE